jgi:hypothetical protein
MGFQWELVRFMLASLFTTRVNSMIMVEYGRYCDLVNVAW